MRTSFILTAASVLTLAAAPAMAQSILGSSSNGLLGNNGSTSNGTQQSQSATDASRGHSSDQNLRDTQIGGLYANPTLNTTNNKANSNSSTDNGNGNGNSSNQNANQSASTLSLSAPVQFGGANIGGVSNSNSGHKTKSTRNSSSSSNHTSN